MKKINFSRKSSCEKVGCDHGIIRIGSFWKPCTCVTEPVRKKPKKEVGQKSYNFVSGIEARLGKDL